MPNTLITKKQAASFFNGLLSEGFHDNVRTRQVLDVVITVPNIEGVDEIHFPNIKMIDANGASARLNQNDMEGNPQKVSANGGNSIIIGNVDEYDARNIVEYFIALKAEYGGCTVDVIKQTLNFARGFIVEDLPVQGDRDIRLIKKPHNMDQWHVENESILATRDLQEDYTYVVKDSHSKEVEIGVYKRKPLEHKVIFVEGRFSFKRSERTTSEFQDGAYLRMGADGTVSAIAPVNFKNTYEIIDGQAIPTISLEKLSAIQVDAYEAHIAGGATDKQNVIS